jgi:hypothetical protein
MLPIYRSDPVLMQSALHSRYRGGSDEPITAWTNLYTCLHRNLIYHTFLIRYRVRWHA